MHTANHNFIQALLFSTCLLTSINTTAAPFTWDIDGDGEVKPLTDGLLHIRYHFGFRGNTLISNAVSNTASRTSATDIEAYLSSGIAESDIDGDGLVKPLTDSLLLLRYLFGFHDTSLITNAVDQNASRTLAADIEQYILLKTPNHIDTDNDGITDINDPDDDNDGLLDTVEIAQGTDPYNSDSDGDGVADNIDDFPLDSNKATSYEKAHRFLVQATFGPSTDDLQEVETKGIEAWVDKQLALPSAYDNTSDAHQTHLQRLIEIATTAEPNTNWFGNSVFNKAVASFTADEYQMAAWWENALSHPTKTAHGADQLRQKIAYALSQIVVVSNGESPLHRRGEALASYYDILAKNAFGNYRDLLGEISRSPTMGVYLSHQGNRKTDLAAATSPDENFAREVIQLFTIGLYELNNDGSFNRDSNPNTYPDAGTNIIPTYTQNDIAEMAKVMTGWDLVGNNKYGKASFTQGDYTVPMEFTTAQHEDEVAEGGDGLITLMGQTFALNSGADHSGMDAALDVLFQHPNIAPFISRHLIMRLVTSNPSADYIARVSQAFNDNGNGVKGDLKAVVKAILLDEEARLITNTQATGFGKVKEPLLAFTQFLRAFTVRPLNGWIGKDKSTVVNNVYWYKAPEKHFGQAPLRSPSVFNYYSPDFIPSDSSFAQNARVAPELQIQTDQVLVEMNNRFYSLLNTYEYNKITVLDGKTLSQFAASKKFNSENLFLIDFTTELNVYEQALDGNTNGDFANMELINPTTGLRYKDSAIDALLEHLNKRLLGGTMTTEYRAGLKHYLLSAAGSRHNNDYKEAWLNIRDAVRLIVTSSAYMVQK